METEGEDHAFVLHRYPFSDSSLVLEVITAGHGRLGLLARGARRPRSALGGLEAGRPFVLRWRGRGELPTLVSADEVAPARLPGPWQGLCLFYVNELVLRLTVRNDPVPELFAAYAEVLEDLWAGARATWHLRRFEQRLLRALGWAADLPYCTVCGTAWKLGSDAWSQGPGAAPRCPLHAEPGGLILTDAMIQWLSGSMIQAPVSSIQDPLRRYLRAQIDELLDGRPLESRRLLAAYLRRQKDSGRQTW
ncbi:DNA repair protein RecO [Acidithiobacillus caldus]|jgi:DNA repair protein RecO (recombination protein O)|uniref:DNA repair protein RecO n=1 Tax=Acidithiobacillus caldus (strain ATCC 51756 / DSM 8584 / KU) TaxID=637389 RepID=A0A060A1H8_ACICK|nr:DNA repair protein RecO [Acidithiobacillus caldus]AIA55992.1 DNA recombination and repair protein RecO [Acidithiobacillus caldus ATCC 51756]MBU2728435.1 DNA repair protein RecO [Acidithiobacillus caldus]MBU2737116.1 DNA repair protein RecO [Acidithiobacillus caldus ATCC 51756]MBU2744917.1 DNA repair protein RecO [Acidithiobacillus caldus]MBU2779375.1 DNA repair protein RecO [Acidithiobacillus caldus]